MPFGLEPALVGWILVTWAGVFLTLVAVATWGVPQALRPGLNVAGTLLGRVGAYLAPLVPHLLWLLLCLPLLGFVAILYRWTSQVQPWGAEIVGVVVLGVAVLAFTTTRRSPSALGRGALLVLKAYFYVAVDALLIFALDRTGQLATAGNVLGIVAVGALVIMAHVAVIAALSGLWSPYCTFLSRRYLIDRKTNWIGVAGIFVAVAALILILSIMSGFLAESRKHLRGNLSDFIVAPRQDVAPMPPADVGPFLAALRTDPRVEAACAQINWVGLFVPERRGESLSNPVYNDLSLVNLVGIDLADENATTGFRESLLSENRFGVSRVHDPDDPFAPPPGYEPDGKPLPGVVVGAQLAYSFGLDIGDEVELVTATIDPRTGRLNDDPTNRKVLITGTFRTGENEMDLERVYFDRTTLGEDILARGVPWSHVLVKLHDYERDKLAFAEDLRALGVEMDVLHEGRTAYEKASFRREVQTWEEYRGSLLGAIENEKSLMGVMLSLVVLVAGFTVFALLSMMVSEKRRDIGIIASLGGTPWRIMGLFVLIGCWEVLLGASLGAGAGVWAALNIDPIERGLSSALGVQIFDRNVYLFDHIPSVVTTVGVAWIIVFAVVCVLVFSAVPAWRAARLNPVDALRYE